jgi:hypothetical protein
VRNYYDYDKEIVSSSGLKFYKDPKLKKSASGVKTRADALAIRSNITSEMYNKISTQLKGCIPNAIIPYV